MVKRYRSMFEGTKSKAADERRHEAAVERWGAGASWGRYMGVFCSIPVHTIASCQPLFYKPADYGHADCALLPISSASSAASRAGRLFFARPKREWPVKEHYGELGTIRLDAHLQRTLIFICWLYLLQRTPEALSCRYLCAITSRTVDLSCTQCTVKDFSEDTVLACISVYVAHWFLGLARFRQMCASFHVCRSDYLLKTPLDWSDWQNYSTKSRSHSLSNKRRYKFSQSVSELSVLGTEIRTEGQNMKRVVWFREITVRTWHPATLIRFGNPPDAV